MKHTLNFNMLKSSVLLCILAYSSVTNAGDVTFVPRLSVSETYTDNINLTQANQESDFITQLNPGFNLIMDGSRFDANVDYNMQNLFYLKDSGRNQTYHQLRANSTTELARNILFFDLDANISQQVIDPERPSNNNNISPVINQTNAITVAASPYWRQTFGRYVSTNVRYRYSVVTFDEQRFSDSVQGSWDATVNRPTSQTGMTWQLNYRRSKTDFETANNVEFNQISADLGYRFNPGTRIFVRYGDEENIFDVVNNGEISGTFWSVGADWRAGNRDTLTAIYGRRFFGNTSSFSWNHTGAKLSFNASYAENLTTINSTVQRGGNGQIPSINGSTDAILQKLGLIGLNYTVSKTILSLQYLNDVSTFASTGLTTKQEGAIASVSVQNTPTTQYVLSYSYRDVNNVGTNFKSYENRTSFGVNHQLTPSTDLNFRIDYNKRNTNDSSSDYDENLASIGLTTNFR